MVARGHRALKGAATVFVGILALTACAPASLGEAPEAPAMSDEQRESAYNSSLDSRWASIQSDYPELERPEVARVRWISPQEMPSTIADCLTAAGFSASVTVDALAPSLSTSVPESQEGPLMAAWYVCDAEYPIDPLLSQEYSSEEVAYLYDYYTVELLPCLRAHGQEPADAPSRQVFTDTFGTADGWDPYEEYLGMDQAELAELAKACPPQPHGLRGN